MTALFELEGVKEALKYLDNLLQTLPDYADDWNYYRAGLLTMDGENTKALSVLVEVGDPGSMILPTYGYYLTKACIFDLWEDTMRRLMLSPKA